MALHPSIKYVVLLLAVIADILEDRLIDRRLYALGVRPTDVVWDDILSGLFVGGLTFLLLHYCDRAKAQQQEKLRVIALMNHHVRNALQIIQCRAVPANAEAIHDIDDAVRRIDWALREILGGKADDSAAAAERPWTSVRPAGGCA
jgi:hypothetical protein